MFEQLLEWFQPGQRELFKKVFLDQAHRVAELEARIAELSERVSGMYIAPSVSGAVSGTTGTQSGAISSAGDGVSGD